MDALTLRMAIARFSGRQNISTRYTQRLLLLGILLIFNFIITVQPTMANTLRSTLGEMLDQSNFPTAKTKLVQLRLPLPANLGDPVSMASGDFDGDGVIDLVVGYAQKESGNLLLLRGLSANLYAPRTDLDSIGSADVANWFAAPEKTQTLSFVPDRILAGDFDADGKLDLVVMTNGSSRLNFVVGTGHGGFAKGVARQMAGQLTDIVIGEWQQRDGLPDLLVETQVNGQAMVHLLQHSDGAFSAERSLWDAGSENSKSKLFQQEKITAVVAEKLSQQPQNPSSPVSLVDDVDTLSGNAIALTNKTETWIPASSKILSNNIRQDLATENAGVDALYMRLSADATEDLVVLQASPIPALKISFNLPVAIITVNDTGDDNARDGVITFREAIDITEGILAVATLDVDEQAQVSGVPASAQLDQISFDIPGAGPHVISPVTRLRDFLDSVVIDGTTEPDYISTPIVQLDGSADDLGDGEGITALRILGGDSLIRGLVVSNFVLGTIGGSAILVFGKGGSILEGNFIGTDPTGTQDSGNGGNGVQILDSNNNLVGGTTAAARNIISGQGFSALSISGSSSTGNRIEGNYFGTDITGSLVIGNDSNNIDIKNGASENTIGGLAVGSRNVISGNLVINFPNIVISRGTSGNPNPTGNIFQGNYIGTDVTGMIGLGNASVGVFMTGGAGANLIGGTAAGAGNIISSSGLDGLRIGGSTTANFVQGNMIGTDVTGTGNLGNSGHGVYLVQQVNTPGTQVGGTEPGAGNIIAFNGGDGVYYDTGIGSSPIQGNSIFDNADLGIDLCANYNSETFTCDDLTSVNDNDIDDVDTGANSLLNFPVLTSAESISGISTQIVGTYAGAANITLDLEFFANTSCDSSGYGEAKTPLGIAQISTDATGAANFLIDLASSTTAGEFAVASATDAAGNTSELSACVAITGAVQDMVFMDSFES